MKRWARTGLFVGEWTQVVLRLVAVLLPVLHATSAYAQSAENVAVVVNDASPVSQRIADYYVRKRGIPAGNAIHIRTVTTDDVSRAVYNATIEAPIATALGKRDLQDRILYLVLTKDIPLRVTGTTGPQGTMSSVDSELTLLYRKMTGRSVPVTGHVDNPYFLDTKQISEAVPFSHALQDIYLVTRLDAFTVDDVIALIDKASAPATNGKVVLDEKNFHFNRSAEGWLEEAARRLRDAGQSDRVVLDQTTDGVRDVSPVLGYYSWGSNDPANRVRHYNMGFAPGAIVGTFVSSDARTFKEPPADWVPSEVWNDPSKQFAGSPQSLIGDLIHEGATGAAGHVAEPYLESTVRPNILFPAYFTGLNLAESYYLAIPHLSWQTVVVGDPLCRPFAGKVLTSAEIDPGQDPATELPRFFSKRRLDVTRAQNGAPAEDNVALLVRAETRLAKADVAGARKLLEQVTAADPLLAGAQFQLAILYESLNDHHAAIERYRKVLALQPNNVVALNNLAYGLAVYENTPQEARPMAERAAALAPRDPTILDTDGWVQHLLGNDADAAKIFSEALRAPSASAEIRVHAAIVYAATGAVAVARLQLDAATTLDPSLNSREDVKELRKRLEKKHVD